MLDEKIGSEWLKMTNNKMVQGIWDELIDAFDNLTGLQYNMEKKIKNLRFFISLTSTVSMFIHFSVVTLFYIFVFPNPQNMMIHVDGLIFC